MVYVLSINGQPLMPTKRHRKVRLWLETGKAKVVKRCPFTIQLLFETGDIVQPVSLGIDAGSKTIGISATTSDKVLYEAEVELRNDITDLLSTRRELRRSRRNRKTRYRKPRFNNRQRADKWLAPSVKHKADCHLTVIAKVCKILPVSKMIIETASFDIQKIKNHDIQGIEYQQGEQLNFWNIREYVLFRDEHKCQCCKGRSKDNILNVHHIETRKTGGDSPDNLITLCETCHKKYHRNEIALPKSIRRGMSFRDAAFMGIMRWAVYEQLKALYPDVSMTFGYITKNTRVRNDLPKTHCVDARCISGNPLAEPLGYYYCQRKIRCHNRQLHKQTFSKGNIRKNNQSPYVTKGFRLFDKVRYNGTECFITGRRQSGYFQLAKLDKTIIHKSASYKQLTLLEKAKSYITERRRTGVPPTTYRNRGLLPKN